MALYERLDQVGRCVAAASCSIRGPRLPVRFVRSIRASPATFTTTTTTPATAAATGVSATIILTPTVVRQRRNSRQ